MHCHTGCTCWTFVCYMCLNDSSNWMPKRMHSHIVCICLTHFHCVISCVSLNLLPDGMHSHTVGTWLTWLQGVFFLQMYPQNVSTRGCIITLVAFVRLFSPVWVFKCFLKLLAWEQSHLVHLMYCNTVLYFSVAWMLKPKCNNRDHLVGLLTKSHLLHLFDFPPLCVFKYIFRLPAQEDA